MSEKETVSDNNDGSMDARCITCPHFVRKYKKLGINFGVCKEHSFSSEVIVSENGLCKSHPRYSDYR
jgi:hypothetical protein